MFQSETCSGNWNEVYSGAGSLLMLRTPAYGLRHNSLPPSRAHSERHHLRPHKDSSPAPRLLLSVGQSQRSAR